MKTVRRMVLSMIGVVLLASVAQAGPILLNTVGVAHTENFDAILNIGSTGGGSVPIDQEITAAFWGSADSGWWNGSGTSFGTATDGPNGNSSRLLSYGVDGVAERALGVGWRDGGLAVGAQFQNATGGAITDLDISYDGELWYHGAIGAVATDNFFFEYSTDATTLLDGAATWIAVSALHFTPPAQGVAPQFTPRDGNDAAYRVAGISDTISGLSITDGETFFLRWSNDATHGMGIDNVSITVVPEPASIALAGLGLAGLLIFRRKH